MLVLPHPLHHRVLQELRLVGDPPRTVRRRDERGLNDPVHGFDLRLIPGDWIRLGQQGQQDQHRVKE